eukprot:JP439464.1.p1 GENE.JP439464.1~~JP439464.1.p1  ORF type:complete len:58 (-),score=14.33 JP439464.1:223-396(-)
MGEQYNSNVNKRGAVSAGKSKSGSTVGPIVLGFFLFVVVGSALLQIIRQAQTGSISG